MIFIKKNKYIIISFIVIIGIMIYSFFNYLSTWGYFDYYKIKHVCYEKKDLDSDVCLGFTKYGWDLEEYINNEKNKPMNMIKRGSMIELSFDIIATSPYASLQFLSPLIISFAIVGTIGQMVFSGEYKYYLQRMNYKEFLKKMYNKVFIVSLITPISLLLVYLISGLLTNFNMEYTSNIYDSWILNNFYVYIFSMCIIQYLFNILCSNICLLAIKKNKSILLSSLKGFLYFMVFYMIYYIVIYCLIISRGLGFTNLTDFFNITGYWFFTDGINYLYVIPNLIILCIISFVTLYKTYISKEKFFLENETIS